MSEPLYRIRGSSQLRGTVPIHGAKNAALPCLAATLLSAESCVIHNLPNITDVRLFADILRHLGARVEIDVEARCARVHSAQDPATIPPDHLVANQRASFLVMGPLLARCGQSVCAAPGGDVIGQRPLDVHLSGFAALGAEVPLRRRALQRPRHASARRADSAGTIPASSVPRTCCSLPAVPRGARRSSTPPRSRRWPAWRRC